MSSSPAPTKTQMTLNESPSPSRNSMSSFGDFSRALQFGAKKKQEEIVYEKDIDQQAYE